MFGGILEKGLISNFKQGAKLKKEVNHGNH